MEKLFSLLAKLSSPRIPVPLDKQAHFASGFILGFLFGLSRHPIISSSAVSIVAGWKEWYDYRHKENHTPDVWDWVATSLGGILGAMTALFIIYNVSYWS